MKNLLKLFTYITILLISNTFIAQENPFEDITHLGGNINCSSIKGNHAFLGQANYLIVLDKSQAEFEQKAELKFKEEVNYFFILDDYIYLLSDSFYIINISNPVDPVIISRLKLDEPGKNIFVDGSYAYIGRFGSISVVDVSDVNSPQAISTYVTGQQTDDLFVKGNYLYSIDQLGEKLFIFNIEDKSNLNLVKLYNSPQPTSIDIYGNHLYITARKYPDMGLLIYDLTNPEKPKKTGFFPTKVIIGTDTHYRIPARVKVQDNKAYIACNEGYFFILDISDKTNPIELGNQVLFNAFSSVFSMNIDNDKIYLALFSLGFKEIDVTDSSTPVEIKKMKEPVQINWMQADSNYLVIASRDGLWLFDNHSEKPIFMRIYNEWKNISRFFFNENNIVAQFQDSLKIIDFSNPLNAVELGAYKSPELISEICTFDNYVYMTVNGDVRTMEVFDISNPKKFIKKSSNVIPGIGSDLKVDTLKKRVFVSYNSIDHTKYGYIIFDITDPTKPIKLSEVKTIGLPTTITHTGDTLFVGSNDESENPMWNLEAYNISNPSSPMLITSLTGEGSIWDIKAIDQSIYGGITGQSICVFRLLADGVLKMVGISHTLNTIGIVVFKQNEFDIIHSSEGYGILDRNSGKKKKGNGGLRKKRRKNIKKGCITTSVVPARAKNAGCKAFPASCKTGPLGGEVNVYAKKARGWKFRIWSGAANGKNRKTKAKYAVDACANVAACPNVAVAHFRPSMYIDDDDDDDYYYDDELNLFCPITETQKQLLVHSFKIKAEGTFDWVINTIKVHYSTSSKLSQHIVSASLEWKGGSDTQVANNPDYFTFDTKNMVILKEDSVSFKILFWINKMTDYECPFIPELLEVVVNGDDISALPQNYPEGEVSGETSSQNYFTCIKNPNDREGFGSIQSGVDKLNEGETLWVCPGTFEENITVDKKNVLVKSIHGRKVTFIKPKNKDLPVFNLLGDEINIDDFTISGSEEAGVIISGRSDTIIKSMINFNKNGIVLNNAESAYVFDNIINNNENCGVKIDKSQNNEILNNKIGVNVDGNHLKANKIGVCITNQSNNNLIGNAEYPNLISGNSEYGILIDDSNTNLILGNKIGTDINGNVAIANNVGIFLKNKSENNQIGETNHSNIISGNNEYGILIDDSNTNLILGNKIGTDINGNVAIANNVGVFLKNKSENNQIGETNHSNIISGNNEYGILIDDSNTNLILGNKIGTDTDGKIAIPNDVGVFIRNNSDNNQIGEIKHPNLISGNSEYGILINDSNINYINGNTIGTDVAGSISIPNKIGVVIRNKSFKNEIANYNTVSGNDKKGILLENTNGNYIDNNYIGTNKYDDNLGQKLGVEILKSKEETVTNNTISNNCIGIKVTDSYNSNISNNFIKNSTCNSSSIHLENSGGKISGNNITKDAGDAINCSKGANPFVVKNNIFENNGFALNNEDPSVHIIAQNNWWGENANPNSSINGNVDYTNWSSLSNDLVIATEADTAYTAPSQSDSLNLYYRNWQYNTDSIIVSITDSQGWIDSLNLNTLVFPDSLGEQNIVYYSVPDVPKGTIDKVIVKAISQINTNWINIDSFFIRAYKRTLDHIEINPDSIASLNLNDSIQFDAIGLDSFNNFFPTELIWSCTGGEIDSTGLYHATELGAFDVIVRDVDSTKFAKKEISVFPVGTINATKPKDYIVLYQNQPNPFSDKTKIKFTLNKSGNTSLIIYDFMGNKQKTLTNRWYPAGTYDISLKSKSLTPGQYFYELRQGNKRVVKKMVMY